MEVRLESLIDGAKSADGVAVIVDVLRCFTTASVALSRGADRIVMVAEVEEAIELRNRGVGTYCVGEVGGKRPDGFDYGNSPTQMLTADIEGRTLIQSTRAGTVGVTAAARADLIYGAALVNASATASVISAQNPGRVTVVAMGSNGLMRSDEDEQCGLYLRNLLQGRRPNPDAVQSLARAGAEAHKYGDPARPHFPTSDLEEAMEVDRFGFAIRIQNEDGLLTARAEYPSGLG